MAVRVALLDPSLWDHEGTASPNTGDLVIARAVLRVINEVFPDSDLVRFPTHVRPTKAALREIGNADFVIVGGSNLIGNRLFWRRRLRYWQQWAISMRDARLLDRAVLLGVGWREYEASVDRHTVRLIRTALSGQAVHSVRDGYTASMLERVGHLRIVNTGCPTLWRLAEQPEDFVSTRRADVVLTTLTDYRQSAECDRAHLELLNRLYEHVVLWPQGAGDLDYMQTLGCPVETLDPGLEALDGFLASEDFDYIGTRLHGGVHCLDAGKRSLIVAVDNRAQEMLPPTGVPYVLPGQLRSMQDWVENPAKTVVRVDRAAIGAWKAQFRTQED